MIRLFDPSYTQQPTPYTRSHPLPPGASYVTGGVYNNTGSVKEEEDALRSPGAPGAPCAAPCAVGRRRRLLPLFGRRGILAACKIALGAAHIATRDLLPQNKRRRENVDIGTVHPPPFSSLNPSIVCLHRPGIIPDFRSLAVHYYSACLHFSVKYPPSPTLTLT